MQHTENVFFQCNVISLGEKTDIPCLVLGGGLNSSLIYYFSANSVKHHVTIRLDQKMFYINLYLYFLVNLDISGKYRFLL